jgi:Predicted integral membrane protein (DUF2269)
LSLPLQSAVCKDRYVSLDEWALAFHVLSAFAFVGGIVLFWVLIVAGRSADTPDATLRMEPVAKVGNAAVGAGAGGTLLLGIWLALSYGDYDLWDGWIIAAIVLWVAAAAVGSRTGVEYTKPLLKARELSEAGQTGPNAELLALNRTQRGILLHGLASLIALAILVVMIWKPGA